MLWFRTTVFALHEELEVTAEQTAAVAGHISTTTQKIYKRNNLGNSKKVNKKLVTALAKDDVVVPDDESLIALRGGEYGRPRPFQIVNGDSEEMPVLPIYAISLDAYYEHVPNSE